MYWCFQRVMYPHSSTLSGYPHISTFVFGAFMINGSMYFGAFSFGCIRVGPSDNTYNTTVRKSKDRTEVLGISFHTDMNRFHVDINVLSSILFLISLIIGTGHL
jgi:hypothetical protein